MSTEAPAEQAELNLPTDVGQNEDVGLPDVSIFVKDEDDAEPAEDTGEPEPTPEPEPEAEPPAPDPALQRALDDFQRRDRDLREREQALKGSAGAAQELQTLKELLKTNPMEAASQAGGLDAWLDAAMPDEEAEKLRANPVVQKLTQQVDKLSKRIEAGEGQAQQRRRQDMQLQVYRGYERFAAEAEATEYPVLKAFAGQLAPNTMYQMATAYAKDTGNMPEMRELASQAETVLRQQAEELVGTLRGLDMFKDVFVPVANGDTKAPPTTSAKKAPVTLRNRDTAEPPPKAKELDLASADRNDVVAAGIAAYRTALKNAEK